MRRLPHTVAFAVLLAGACAPRGRDAPVGAARAPAVTAAAAASVAPPASAAASAKQAPDFLNPHRLEGRPPGEWTLFYPDLPYLDFDRVVSSPKGGVVAHGIEEFNAGKHVLLRLTEEGQVRWAVRLVMRFDGSNADLAVDDEGTIALVAQHGLGLAVDGDVRVPAEEGRSSVSLLVFDDAGKLRGMLSRRENYTNAERKLAVLGGFVTTAFDLVDPYADDEQGLVVVDGGAHLVRREPLGFRPLLIAGGPALVTIGKSERAVKYRGHAILGAMPARGRPFLAASFAPDGALRWTHRFPDRYVYKPTALAQDARGHVFAAFRYGESHGFADDPFAAIVYELDERGREVNQFTYASNAALTRLFPGQDGLTVLGWSFSPGLLTLRRKPLPGPVNTDGHGAPVLFLRVAPDGTPVAAAELGSEGLGVEGTLTGLSSIADLAPAGGGFFVAAGCASEATGFAGLTAGRRERPRCGLARIKGP